ncbi:MAG: DNA-3-methyladenine glycosylase 2 family protein [Citrobacter freundii]|nr:MAG: DNA-3-methyladenine glycosylase 2 family protein [Citrobacter freundii]
MISSFSKNNFHSICDELAAKDRALRSIVQTYGYPPMWTRPNSFESLIHIILEQQVSLASALAALNKLKEKLGKVTPAALLKLTDEELKACYFSRQKTIYARALAEALASKKIVLSKLEKLEDDEVRTQLVSLKGIGNWTVDIYLMFVLQRTDHFPIGDLAAVNALKQVMKLPKDTEKEKIIRLASKWKPYRTVATMILWHYYLSTRGKKQLMESGQKEKDIIP